MLSFTTVSSPRPGSSLEVTVQTQRSHQAKPYDRQTGESSSSAERDAALHHREQEFCKRMDYELQFIRGVSSRPLIPAGGEKERFFKAYYKRQLPLKRKELETLQQRKRELVRQLADARQRSDRYGMLSDRPMLSMATAGLVAEAMLHIPTLGLSALVVPPGTGAVVGAAAGKLLSPRTPDQLEQELSDVKSDLEDLHVYLNNLQTEYTLTKGERKRGKLPEGCRSQEHRQEIIRNMNRDLRRLRKQASRELDVIG